MAAIRVAVLRGGPSDEYDVSMQTGKAVLGALDRERYQPLDVIITRSGEWILDGVARYPESLVRQVDVVFNALHGTYGEDGTVQRLLDRLGVRYTGSQSYASAIAMNKMLTKDALREHGVRMAPHMLITRDSLQNIYGMAETIGDMFGPKYVIKPLNSGSSVGTMMVDNTAMLARAMQDALELHDQVLVEKRIIGREATCGVLNRFREKDLYALPPIEIIPPSADGFFDRAVKYDGTTEEICPGRFSHDEKRELERIASHVHDTLGLRQYSRSDFMIAPDGIYFLEVNTLPGLTEQSLFPRAMDAIGSSHRELVGHLIEDALDGWKDRRSV